MDNFNGILTTINDVLWHNWVLYVVIAVGSLLIIWTRFGPLVAMTHGIQVIRGKFDRKDDPGAISHFQALSAALSATIGLGNIGGVALAISLGGPGAVFWMWMVGIVGMALKMTEVTQSMIYRNTSDPDNPHGGPMFVVSQGLREINPSLAGLGRWIGYVFCVTLMISTITGGNMFQAWNVGNVTRLNFGGARTPDRIHSSDSDRLGYHRRDQANWRSRWQACALNVRPVPDCRRLCADLELFPDSRIVSSHLCLRVQSYGSTRCLYRRNSRVCLLTGHETEPCFQTKLVRDPLQSPTPQPRRMNRHVKGSWQEWNRSLIRSLYAH